MASKNVPGQIYYEGLFLRKSTSRLMFYKKFYALLQRYCNSNEKGHPPYDGYLHPNFNLERMIRQQLL